MMLALFFLSQFFVPHSGHAEGLPEAIRQKRYSTALTPYQPKARPDYGLKDTVTALGKRARGFYLTPYWLLRVGAEKTARILKAANMNTVVIDVKDDFGQILYPSTVALSKNVQRVLIRDPKQVIDIFHKHNFYVIARVVCFKDSRLSVVRPDLSVRVGPRADRLFSAGAGWIDAFAEEVRDYLVDIAVELQQLGFDEVQYDYVRFPKGKAGTLATWLHEQKAPPNLSRAKLIASFLERTDRSLRIPLSVDIYGLTTLVNGDPRELGQAIEHMVPYIEAVSPMMYANGMTGYFDDDKVTEKVYGFIHCGLWRTRHKAPDIILRPYLQAYPNNVESFWGPDFITQQVAAADRAGANGFLFWNATMKNSVAYRALRAIESAALDRWADNAARYKLLPNAPEKWCYESQNYFGGRSTDQSTRKSRPSIRTQPN